MQSECQTVPLESPQGTRSSLPDSADKQQSVQELALQKEKDRKIVQEQSQISIRVSMPGTVAQLASSASRWKGGEQVGNAGAAHPPPAALHSSQSKETWREIAVKAAQIVNGSPYRDEEPIPVLNSLSNKQVQTGKTTVIHACLDLI
jgi:hypothetical protein